MNPRRLLLVGWEAADWKILHPLLDAGEMPALNRLVENGASGALPGVQPPVSAMQWTALATGKRAWQHGVCHALAIPIDGDRLVPVTARNRRSAALWEILTHEGRRSLAAGWPATQGTQDLRAKIVSDRYPEPTAPPGVKPWPPAVSGTYWPPEIGAGLDKLRVSPEEIAADVVSRYVPLWRQVDQKRDRRIGQLRVLLATDFSYMAAITALMAGGEWDFAAVRFPALGAVKQIFMPFQPPQGDSVADDEFQIYRNVINSHCRTLDLMLRRLVELAGKDTAVMVVSGDGIFAAGGPGFARDALLHGASVLDVAPTVLAWFGLPIGDDMEGRVLLESFPEATPVERVPCWETRLGLVSQVLREGGPDGNLRREAAWNFAQSCLEASRHDEALPVLQELFQDFPEHAETSHALFQCQLALGRLTDAEQTLEVALEALPAGGLSLLPRAELAWAKRDFRQARSLAGQARRLDLTHGPALRRLGMLLLHLREWDALAELAERVLRLDDNDAIAWLGLAEAQLRKGQPGPAGEAARRAIGLMYFLPDAHFVLARALVAQGKWREARDAMQTLLQLQPNHRTAPAYLKRIPRDGG